ncbi:MAG: hypothetical protein AAF366_04085 [Pseudomonadota bacterium]
MTTTIGSTLPLDPADLDDDLESGFDGHLGGKVRKGKAATSSKPLDKAKADRGSGDSRAAQGKTAGLAILALGLLLAGAAEIRATVPDFHSEQRFRYSILAQDIREVLREFAGSFALPIAIDDEVRGQVANFDGALSATEFLNQLAARYALSWYYDGTTLYIAPAEANRSVVIDFDAVPAEELNAALEEMGVADPRFVVRTTGDQGLGVLSGPPRYIEMVESAFTMLENRRRPDAAPSVGATTTSMLIVRGDDAGTWTGAVAPPEPAEIEE